MCVAADDRGAGEDRPTGLEAPHAAQALHGRSQHRALVLARRRQLRQRDAGATPAVCHRQLPGTTSGVQGIARSVLVRRQEHFDIVSVSQFTEYDF